MPLHKEYIERVISDEHKMHTDFRIPKRYMKASLSDIPKMNFDNMKEKDLYIFGPSGTGKTHLAVSLIKEYIKDSQMSCLFTTLDELLTSFRDSYNNKHIVSESELYKKYNEDIHVLVIDDIGSQRLTDWGISVLNAIVNTRYNNCVITIWTSNMNPDVLYEYVGDRIASRILNSSKHIQLAGKDKRRQYAEK